MENRLFKQGSSDRGGSGGVTKLVSAKTAANKTIDTVQYFNFWRSILILDIAKQGSSCIRQMYSAKHYNAFVRCDEGILFLLSRF